MEIIQRPTSDVRRNLCVAFAVAPAIGFLAARLINLVASRKASPTRPSIYRAPRRDASTTEAYENLPYPANALPGARDIETPFGITRAYEFGPEDGRKVLLVHGISTPCLSMAPLAKLLSTNGCRVCLYDLFGRGYSDTPDPSSHRQDFALFSSQIFSVVTSSPLDWAGEGFSLVGYSLGGGISSCFTSYYPSLVKNLVLLAPGGVIKRRRMTAVSQFLYGGYLPRAVVERIVTLRMRFMGGEPSMRPPESAPLGAIDVTRTATRETPDSSSGQDGWIDLFGQRICPDKAVEWQLYAHPGFVPSFVSSLMYGPVYDCHDRLKVIGCSVLVILGKQDSVILANDTWKDIRGALGKNLAECVILEGGHDLGISNSEQCAKSMLNFWGVLRDR